MTQKVASRFGESVYQYNWREEHIFIYVFKYVYLSVKSGLAVYNPMITQSEIIQADSQIIISNERETLT